MNSVVLFSDLTTEEVLLKIEAEAKEYQGLYVDMNDKKQRKYVKDSAASINDLLKKIERARIDKSKDYKVQVEAEAKLIKERLEAANSPFSSLINGYNEERAKILAEEKRKQQEVIDALQYERDYDEAGQLNRLFDLELKEAAAKAREEAAAKVEREKLIAEEAAAQAREEAAQMMIKQQEEAAALIIKNQQESEAREAAAKQAVIDAENKAKLEAEQAAAKLKAQAEQAEIDKQNAIKQEAARIQAEKDAEEAETKKREANKAHKKKINNEAMQAFIDGGMTEECAKLAVTLLANRSINHCQINY